MSDPGLARLLPRLTDEGDGQLHLQTTIKHAREVAGLLHHADYDSEHLDQLQQRLENAQDLHVSVPLTREQADELHRALDTLPGLLRGGDAETSLRAALRR